MAYIKQNFTDGEVLNADQLNHIEDGVSSNEIRITALEEHGSGDVTKAYVDEQNALQDAETDKIKADLTEQSESLEALWKLNKGMTYDFLNKVETGTSVNPAGAFSKSLIDLRGESRQGETPTPSTPQEIIPVEQINISIDGVDKTIIPPFALNGIGDYRDFADIDKGVWVVNTGEYTFTGNEKWLTASDGAKYVAYADDLAGFRFGKDSGDGLYCIADKYGCEKFRTVRESKYEVLSVQLQPNYSRFWASPSVDAGEVGGTTIILVRETPTETPIDSADLDYLRSLVNLDKDVSISITDQNGKDISYMLEYIIKLSEVN